MSNSAEPTPRPKRPRARHWHPLRIVARCVITLALGLGAVLVVGLWWLSTYPVELSPALRDRVVAALEPRLEARGGVLGIDRLSVRLRPGLIPSVAAEGLTLSGPLGNRIVLDRAEILLDRLALLEGRLAPQALRITGVDVAVTRARGGEVTFALGEADLLREIDTLRDLIAALDETLQRPPLADLRTVGATVITLRITDAVTGSVLESSDADLRLDRLGDELALTANLGRIGGREAPGSARVELSTNPTAATADLRLALRGIVPARLEGLSALGARDDLLDRFDIPLSLDLAGSLDEDGALGALTGRLTAGAGRVEWTDPLPVLELSSASADVTASEGGRRFDLTELEIDADVLSVSGRGSVFAEPRNADRLETGRLTAQLALSTVSIDAGASMAGRLTFENVTTDARILFDGGDLNLDSFTHLQFDGDWLQARVRTTGPAGVRDPARRFSLDLSSARVKRDSVFALWPIERFPRTRRWLDENILSGTMHAVAFALRFPPDGLQPEFSLNFGYEAADIRFLDSIAPLTGAAGRATLEGKTFRLEIDQGSVTPKGSPPVTVLPSLMVVPDVTRRPGLLNLDLTMDGATKSFLTVLSGPPFQTDPNAPVLLPPDEATGETAIGATIEVPLGEGGGMQAATFDIAGRVSDFTNSTLLQGRTLAAKQINISATQARLAISGDATVNGQPLAISFTRDLEAAPGGATPPVITANGPLTVALAEAVGVPVPQGVVSGAGRIGATITLGQDAAPPRLALDAQLAGLGVALPEIGIRKSAAAAGSVRVSAELSQPPRISAFGVAMPGVEADGSAALAAGGGLAQVDFSRLQLGGWLSARGSYRPASGNRPARLEIDGGRVDLRRRPQIAGGGGGRPPDVAVRLDRVTISDELRLTGLNAFLPGATGGTGELTARVNDIAPFSADLVRRRAGLAGVLRTENAGELLAAANLFARARGGRLDLSLVPTGQAGHYDGRLRVTGGSLHGAGTAASIVSALSIVGAIEQISGEGIVFTDTGADFNLAPGLLTLNSAYAEGPSLGLTLDGIVDLTDQQIGLQGTVSPIYFLNRLGSPRRGEGLIGVSFRVSGTTRDPRVQVIPMSLLTPGGMRDVFRQPTAAGN